HPAGVAVADHELQALALLHGEALGAVEGALAEHGAGGDAHAEVTSEVMVPADADVAAAGAPGPLDPACGRGRARGRWGRGARLCEGDSGRGRGQKAARHDGRETALAKAHQCSLPCSLV